MIGGWIGVDLDGTLARYDGWKGFEIGAPIEPMMRRVRGWLAEGKTVKIFTARVGPRVASPFNGESPEAEGQRKAVEEWCEKHLGRKLEVTATKDFAMVELWDDRAKAVVRNTGYEVDELVNMAETMLCNSRPMSHCSPAEWDRLVKRWRDAKHGVSAEL